MFIKHAEPADGHNRFTNVQKTRNNSTFVSIFRISARPEPTNVVAYDVMFYA